MKQICKRYEKIYIYIYVHRCIGAHFWTGSLCRKIPGNLPGRATGWLLASLCRFADAKVSTIGPHVFLQANMNNMTIAAIASQFLLYLMMFLWCQMQLRFIRLLIRLNTLEPHRWDPNAQHLFAKCCTKTCAMRRWRVWPVCFVWATPLKNFTPLMLQLGPGGQLGSLDCALNLSTVRTTVTSHSVALGCCPTLCKSCSTQISSIRCWCCMVQTVQRWSALGSWAWPQLLWPKTPGGAYWWAAWAMWRRVTPGHAPRIVNGSRARVLEALPGPSPLEARGMLRIRLSDFFFKMSWFVLLCMELECI